MDLASSILWDGLSFSVIPTFGYVIVGSLWNRATYGPIALAGFALCAFVHVVKQILPASLVWSTRPEGACKCDALNRQGNAAGEPGFPSGHTALAVFLACALRIPYGFVWAALVGYSRITKHCHTWLQVVSGAVVGYVAAALIRR
jgi:membrane-associated phospholipid phosphatase